MTAPAATWLDPDDVRGWLKLAAGVDDELIVACVARAEVEVSRARSDQYVVDEAAGTRTFTPDAEVYNAAVMLAGRVYRRRNSPGGVELFADTVAYVSRYDPEIQRALRQGAWTWPAVG